MDMDPTPPPMIRSSAGVTLAGGGPMTGETLAAALARAPRLVAADGGYDRALALGHRPEAVVGDLDSISPAGRARAIHDPDQETTDFQKAMARIEARFVIGVGFLGGRMDHALAALSALSGPTILLGEDDLAFRAPERLAMDLPEGLRFSLFPLGPAGGESEGLEWPIDGMRFAPDGRIGTSNRVTGPVRLRLHGPMIVLLPPEGLDAALAALSSSAR